MALCSPVSGQRHSPGKAYLALPHSRALHTSVARHGERGRVRGGGGQLPGRPRGAGVRLGRRLPQECGQVQRGVAGGRLQLRPGHRSPRHWYPASIAVLQYCLSTVHLFRDTEAVPDIMARLLARLQTELGIISRPVVIHCLCDTGVICYQGLAVALRRAGLALDIRGVVWDSCPGPYPQVTSHWPLQQCKGERMAGERGQVRGVRRGVPALPSQGLEPGQGWPHRVLQVNHKFCRLEFPSVRHNQIRELRLDTLIFPKFLLTFALLRYSPQN